MFSCCLGRGSTSETPHAHGSKTLEVDARKLNDSLHELWKPSGTPNMELLFFHGLQFGDLSDAHLRTWESEDGYFLWPQKWLVEKFAMARILCVSYDGCVRKSSGNSFDMHVIVENLISDFVHGKIGQTPNCPVVLIGHCFGGLVIEKLCLEANKLKQVGLESHRPQIGTFLDNVKGMFFYGVPHHGTLRLSKATKLHKSPLLSYFEALGKDASRLDFEFNQLRREYAAWQIWGLGENLPGDRGIFDGTVAAPEPSARYGDYFNMLAVDHMSICKPRDEKDKRFYFLTELLHIIARQVEVPVHESRGLPRYPIDLEKRALEVRKKLSGGTILGLFGMGGIGKTTLAKQIFNAISKDFEYSCFLDNVKGIPAHDLEERVLNHFHHNGVKSDKGSTQWFNLKNKKSLIVMDDINSEGQLRVLPQLEHFATGSCVIMTSRDRQVFENYEDCIIHEVEFLKPDDAKKLFCHYAFGLKDIPDVLIDHVNAVVKKCDGLPLTLEVIGKYLRDHGTDLNIWKETLNRLGKAQAITGHKNDRVWASLKVSYDNLSEEEQEMFLEAALIFFGKPLDHALAAWSTLSETRQMAWNNLVNRSLVREPPKGYYVNSPDPSDEDKEVWVHEQLRDLALKIANGIMESGSDETVNSIVDGLNDNKGNPSTKCLSLSYSEDFRKNRTTLQLDPLAKLESLKYIYLLGVPSKDSGKVVMRKISVLNLEGVPRGQLSKFEFNLKNLENLAILELSHFQIPEDFPEALGNLTNLQILNLSDLQGLDRLPENFGSLRRLRKLKLRLLSSMILPKSFGNLVALEYLTLFYIESLQLPESLGDVSSLVKLTIAHCRELTDLPESFGRLTSLKELYISRCRSIKCLPKSLSQASSLVTLKIRNCKKFVGLPDTFGSSLASLENISISRCPSIKGLPQCFSRLPELEKLLIEDCKCLEELGDGFGNLSSLRELVLDGVALKGLPANFSLLSRLEFLTIRSDGQLTSLPDNFGILTALKKLDISAPELGTLSESFRFPKFLQEIKLECQNFESLPESLWELGLLEKLMLSVKRVESLPLSVGDLHSLRHLTFESSVAKLLPDSLGRLSSLKTLKLGCPHLERLPDSLGELSSLEEMSINSSSVESLPDSLGKLSSLKKVELSSCKRLKSLPESLGRRQQEALQRGDQSDKLMWQARESSEPMTMEAMTLSIYVCPLLDDFNLANLGWMAMSNRSIWSIWSNTREYRRNPNPDSSGQFSSLKEVTVCSYARLKTLSESAGMLSSLENLTIQCDMLESLPDSLGQLSSLKSLTIERCDKLEGLPDSLGQLSSLESLTTRECDILESLPDSLGKLSSLESLTIQSCGMLESLLDSLGKLSSLESLTIQSYRMLKNLPDSLEKLSSLKSLTIDRCHMLESLPNSLGQLSSLESLTIDSCSMLESLPDSLGKLSSLESLTIAECRMLESLPDSLGQLSSLKSLTIERCYVLECLPDSLGQPSSLKSLTILECDTLESLPDSLGQLSSLKSLTIEGCDILESLPDSLGQLSSLESLTIDGCDMLKSLPNSLGQLSSLEEVILLSCDGLKTLPESLGRWSRQPACTQGGESDQLMWQAEEFSHPMKTKAMTLSVYKCPFLDDSVLNRLGWMLLSYRPRLSSYEVDYLDARYYRRYPVPRETG